MLLDYLKTALVTLLVTLDTPGLAPVFIGLTLGMSASQKREVALRACLIAFVILALFAFGGRLVMDALGISPHEPYGRAEAGRREAARSKK